MLQRLGLTTHHYLQQQLAKYTVLVVSASQSDLIEVSRSQTASQCQTQSVRVKVSGRRDTEETQSIKYEETPAPYL